MELVKKSMLKAGSITLLILLVGLLAGLQADDMRTDFIQQQLEESSLRSQTFVVTEKYLSESSKNYCEVVSRQIPDIAEKNAQIGRDLQSFSSKSVSNRARYKLLKEEYYVNQLRLYNTIQGYNKRCNASTTTIFFFFDESIQSQRQGTVLTEYREEVDNETYIFSYNLDTKNSTVMEILKQDFNVTDGPTVVVNGNRTFREYVSLKRLRSVIE
ncbi:MAG: hypothetical protein ABEJ56_03630 [Candidatus Nanohaloarchaea archaeon]